MNLHPQASLPGQVLVTLGGTPGAIRLRIYDGSYLEYGQALTNPPPQSTYAEALLPGPASVDIAFRHETTNAPNYSCAFSLPVMAYGVDFQPVTTVIAPNGTAIVNPAVVGLGWLARYSISVLPSSIPDSDIVWGIAQGTGNIRFYGNNNKGRSVVVEGLAVGDFKLEVTIGSTHPLHPKPYILGKVLPETVTALHFFVIYDAAGNPAVTETEIDLWIDEANRIYRQVAMRFVKANVTPIKNKPNDWFHIGSYSKLEEMCISVSNTGGLEVYCVASLPRGVNGIHVGRNLPPGHPQRGLAIATGAPTHILAHEIGHACGLEDIRDDKLGNVLVSEEWLGSSNWSGGTGTGYYPPDLKHVDLIRRLLMYYQEGYKGYDISLGHVRAYAQGALNPSPIATGLTGLSLDFILMNRNPLH